MSEKYSPKSFDDGDSDYRQFKDMQYRDELLGGAERGSERYEEAKAYDEHLKATDGRSKEEAYDIPNGPDAVDRAIESDPEAQKLNKLAEKIAKLQKDGGSENLISTLKNRLYNGLHEYEKGPQDLESLTNENNNGGESVRQDVVYRILERAENELGSFAQAPAEMGQDDVSAPQGGETATGVTTDSDFANVSADEQRARLRTVFGKDFIDQLGDADLAKYAAVGAQIDSAQPTAEPVVPAAPADAKAGNADSGPGYKDLTDKQKAAIIKDVEGLIQGIDQSFSTADDRTYFEQLVKLQDGLVRDGGMTLDEAGKVIEQAYGQMPSESHKKRPFHYMTDAAANMSAVDGDANNKTSDEILAEARMSPEQRKERDRQRLLYMYRNASSDEMRRINEARFGKDKMQGYDEDAAYGVSDDEAIDIMQKVLAKKDYEPPKLTDLSHITGEKPKEDNDNEAAVTRNRAPRKDRGVVLGWLGEKWDDMKEMPNRRRKIAAAIGGIALTTGLIGGAYVVWKNGGDHSALTNFLGNGSTGGGAKETVAAAVENATHDPQAHVNLVEALLNTHVSPGQGIYDLLASNGIDKSKVSYAELYDLQRQFPKELYLQQVGDLTDVRIMNSGNLSQALADALAKFAHN